jgi:L-seryl-tRNA(Ser) seleniumtransferase
VTGQDDALQARLRALPSVDRVLEALEKVPHDVAVEAARRAVAAARASVRAGGEEPSLEAVAAEARAAVRELDRSLLRNVVNATGVLIHTNLGRAPLGPAQLDAITAVAGGYSNLEYDLGSGRRGSRYGHAARALSKLLGSEAALVVNNNAAALLLCLCALCSEREVVISRGELIEIGGEFRIPEVMALSRARLVEVGTTNRTHLADYERAIGADTAAILKVHPSNYRMIGFTASVGGRDLARLARGRGILFLHDVGSGFVGAAAPGEAPGEPPVDVSLSEGADLVTFSGDKLLGGPQAGVIAGRSDLVETISSHPLLRALRVDKMTLAGLQATASAYLEGGAGRLPLWTMALASLDELEQRARAMARRVSERATSSDVKVEAVASRAVTGGGSQPGLDLSSWAVALGHGQKAAMEVERGLRHGVPAVIARIEDDRVIVDLRTVPPSQDGLLEDLLLAALL